MSQSRAQRAPRRAVTLLELLLTLAIVSVLAAMVVPGVRRLADEIGARGAAGDAAELFGVARQLAMARWERTNVAIDTALGVLTLTAGPDTLMRRDVRREHGVTLHATRVAATYTPLGLALGVSNLSIITARGSAAETVTVSRLGRVRW